MLGKVIKGAEIAMQNAILLQQRVHQLNASNNQRKEREKTTRASIQDGGSLTGAEGQQRSKIAREGASRITIIKATAASKVQ